MEMQFVLVNGALSETSEQQQQRQSEGKIQLILY